MSQGILYNFVNDKRLILAVVLHTYGAGLELFISITIKSKK